jgi:hypothetical protein
LNNFGRILVLGLLSIRVLINALEILWLLLFPQFSFAIGIRPFYGEPFFETENPYLVAIILFLWLVIALLTLIFLTQKETKNIFMSEVMQKAGSTTVTESASN